MSIRAGVVSAAIAANPLFVSLYYQDCARKGAVLKMKLQGECHGLFFQSGICRLSGMPLRGSAHGKKVRVRLLGAIHCLAGRFVFHAVLAAPDRLTGGAVLAPDQTVKQGVSPVQIRNS